MKIGLCEFDGQTIRLCDRVGRIGSQSTPYENKLSLFCTPTGDVAEDRRIRRRDETGELRRLANGVYLEPGAEPDDMVIRRNWSRPVAKLVPGAVVTDRSSIGARPVQHVQNGPR